MWGLVVCTFLFTKLSMFHTNCILTFQYPSPNYEFLIVSRYPLTLCCSSICCYCFGSHWKWLLCCSLHLASTVSHKMNKWSRLWPWRVECTVVLIQSFVHAALATPSSALDSHRSVSHNISSGTRNPPLFASAWSWKVDVIHSLIISIAKSTQKDLKNDKKKLLFSWWIEIGMEPG